MKRYSKKSRNNRKGWINNIQMAILAIAAMIVFTLFLYQMYTGLKERMTIQSCKASIDAHHFVAQGTARDVFTDIKCPTNEITIKNLKTAKAVIAEDVHRCWYIWGQGKNQYFADDGNFCHVCSIYQFSDKRKTVNGFMQYLSETNIQIKYPGDTPGTTYAQYLSGTKTSLAEEKTGRTFSDLSNVDTFNTSQRYATIFVYASGKDNIQKALEGGGRTARGTAGLGGVLVGGAGVTIGLFIASNPVGWIVGGVGAIAYGAVSLYQAFNVKEPETLQFIAFRPYDVDELQNLSCEKLAVNQMSNAASP